MRVRLTAMVVAGAMIWSAAVESQSMEPRQVLQSLFDGETVRADMFAPSFLSQVPTAEVARLLADLKRGQGELAAIEKVRDGFALRFERGKVPARIALDRQGRIAGLWFGAVEPAGDIPSLATSIAELPGRTSLLVVTDGEDVAAHNAETPMAVGSAAKLAVLLAVKRAVAEKRLAWEQVVPLDPAWTSLPTGQLQDWPAGTPVTLATLANLMISISDNTATDGLIRLVGRDQVEAVTPRNRPFPTTRELFILKAQQNNHLRAAWEAGDADLRQKILKEIADAPLPAGGDLSPEVTHETEWFMTARELCGLLEATADLPGPRINAGPVAPEDWESVAYKGGSELGVLNLSARLQGEDGRIHCVVATWNDEEAPAEERLMGLMRGIVGRLADDDSSQ